MEKGFRANNYVFFRPEDDQTVIVILAEDEEHAWGVLNETVKIPERFAMLRMR